MSALPPITAADLAAPLPWLAALDADQVRQWLRLVLRHRRAPPLRLDRDTALAPALARHLQPVEGPLRDHVCEAVPRLLSEARPSDDPAALDDLLVLAGLLRCGGAVGPIRRLVEEGLGARSGDPALLQRALAALAGFGLDRRLAPLFEDALEDRPTAAIAWRALCSWDLGVGAATLPRLHRQFARDADRPRLLALVRAQLFGALTPRRRARLVEHVVWQVDDRALPAALQILADAGLGLRGDVGATPAGTDTYTICERPRGPATEAALGPLRTRAFDPDRGREVRLSEERWSAVDHVAWSWEDQRGVLDVLDQLLVVA